jgi:hypothetical protein
VAVRTATTRTILEGRVLDVILDAWRSGFASDSRASAGLCAASSWPSARLVSLQVAARWVRLGDLDCEGTSIQEQALTASTDSIDYPRPNLAPEEHRAQPRSLLEEVAVGPRKG